MKCFLVMLSLIYGISLCDAQGIIRGKILDATNSQPLTGAHIYLLENWKIGAISDINGGFEMKLSQEQFDGHLIISYIGFQEKTIPISRDMTISLEPIALNGSEVIVTAQKVISEEFKYVQFKKLDIYTNPAAKADPILAVNSLPSTTTTDESANISLRGSSPAETGIFINNVPVYDAVRYSQLNGIGTFSIFNTAMMKEVTVFPGNPPVEFGSATSGVVSMTTDESIIKKNTNSVIVGLANFGYFREQKIAKNQSLKIFSNWQPSDALIAINKKSMKNLDSFNSGDLGAYWYGKGKYLSWKLFSYNLLEGYKYQYNHPSFSGIFNQDKRRHLITSNINYSITPKSDLQLNMGFSYGSGNYQYSSAKFNILSKDYFLGLNYLYRAASWNLKTGFSHNNRRSDYEGNKHKYAYAIGLNHPMGKKKRDTTTNESTEAFAYWKKYLGEKFTFGLGVRKNIPTNNQKNYLTKQANLSFIQKKWAFILGTGQYFKTDVSEYSGNTFTASSKQLSLDVKYTSAKFQSTLSLFHKDNWIDKSNYQISGVELFFNYRVSEKLKLSQSVTYFHSKADKNSSYSFNVPFFYRGYIAYKPWSNWEINTTALLRSGTFVRSVTSSKFHPNLDVYQPFYSTEKQRLPIYFSLGLSVSKIFLLFEKYNIVAFASLNNATNHENVRGFNYNQDYSVRTNNIFSGRIFFTGAVISF